jgi:hypothetical protein
MENRKAMKDLKQHISNLVSMTQQLSSHLRCILTLSFIIYHLSYSVAQISIGGNVYGGGNAGDTGGNTKVTVRAGDLNRVYGGARMANVGGRAFMNIDGAHASNYIIINRLYGGNDIAGTIGTSTDDLPEAVASHAANNSVDKTWNALVLISSKMTPAVTYTQAEIDAAKEGDDAYGKTTNDIKTPATIAGDNKSIYIGQLFGGGNGDYYYRNEGNTHEIYESEQDFKDSKTPIATNTIGFTLPDIGKTFVDIHGGSIVYAYGGGNNATVTESTVISVDNPSKVVNSIKDASNNELLTETRFRDKMGINTGLSYPGSDEFQIGRFFGGNNVATMAIRPTWNLKSGKIRNLYSGGNRGDMTSPVGLLVEIPVSSTIVIDNLYGGCRMANVHPMNGNDEVPSNNVQLTEKDENGELKYKFPAGLAARVLVRGGDINNVYGGNDVTGKVYGGNAVGIYTDVRGDVYGGGNGAYPYTDNPALKEDDVYADLYYNPAKVIANKPDATSVEALNAFRPNAEQVSLRLFGTEKKPTIIGGAVYVGGNCATLKPKSGVEKPMAELKIGSYVIADRVFLGNNGENMVKSNEEKKDENGVLKEREGVLRTYQRDIAGTNSTGKFNSMKLVGDDNVFDEYMDGVTLEIKPQVVFDNTENGDPATYNPYTSFFGSFYCGGNVGSVRNTGVNTIDFDHQVIIFDKLVGGCNNAYVPKTDYNAAFDGGLVGAYDQTTNNKLILNLEGLKLQPKRWVTDNNGKKTGLEWNTYVGEEKNLYTTDVTSLIPTEGNPVEASDNDMNRRFKGGNIYGGCYTSGHINGNVVINIDGTIVDRDGDYGVFDSVSEDEVGEAILYDNDNYNITKRRSGVILDEQGMDVLGSALNVFGGGYGEDSEIWGSTTINLNRGYVFQIFGGGEMGAIGHGTRDADGKLVYSNTSDPTYSTTINVHGSIIGASKQAERRDDMAEAEFIYGGGFEGLIVGNTRINLGNCRVFNTFAGSCNADILGHTETYVGQWQDGETTKTGFPWIRDHIYGGNDLGGRILGTKDFAERVSTEASGKMYNGTGLTTASAYMEYVQGRVDNIFGGCYGDYDYSEYEERVTDRPFLDNAFVNFRPNAYSSNAVKKVFGAGQGHTGERDGDKCQNRSYVLIDIPQNVEKYTSMEIFGAGSYNGLGMKYEQLETTASTFDLDKASAIVDLIRGQVGAAYGASYNEGITRRTLVNVPSGSTIKIGKIFGGAYGVSNEVACDAYEATVNYSSSDAEVSAIYGGNNSYRRTLYGTVNINCPVWSNKAKGYQATVYGAGFGVNTWSQYTEVNLNNGAVVYEAYGGGENGQVLNTASVREWADRAPGDYDANLAEYNTDMTAYEADFAAYETAYAQYLINKAAYEADPEGLTEPKEPVKPIAPEKPIESLYTDLDGYTDNGLGDADHYAPARSNRLHSVDATRPEKYNTNVHIYEGATVTGYCYGGGLGDGRIKHSGNVYGTTYIDLLGGIVAKDLYAAGTTGSVKDSLGIKNGFVASSTAYIEGGTARNVYGGGWKGSVGQHNGAITTPYTNDILGETHVVIGKLDGTSFINGIPAIERNAYGGGEGGAVFGTTNITLNNGFIGYRHFDSEPTDEGLDTLQVWSGPKTNEKIDYYQEKLHDETWKGDGTNRLYDSGNIFGGGYIDNSSVDITNVKMYGGHVRNALFGGGEIAAIGRGIINASGQDNSIRVLQGIYKAGKANVELYDGHVHRNVFGGGRGYNNLGEGGKLFSDGYVFGQTEVCIYGGEVGTAKELANSNGNVFGGGDIGYVYSAIEDDDGNFYVGVKDGARYDGLYEGYYYKFKLNPGQVYNGEDATTITNKGEWVMSGPNNEEYNFTEDCKVLIEPHCKAKENVNINGHLYNAGDYVPTSDLNTLGNKTDSRWDKLEANNDDDGIIIYNAVFAGGNTSSGSSRAHANATSVFGNATASIHDVYHRDLITIGTGHTGGLYGDGNLTFVDGYRGLNITNYGTDYYTISSKSEITIDEYHDLPKREAAYYELRYKCIQECTDRDGTTYHKEGGAYSKASTLTADDILTLFKAKDGYTVPTGMFNENGTINTDPETGYWEENGVCSIYAGRIMNTIQRADFCGVFGSRMVMQGAEDRVPEEVDYTNYTINRVREVSLNKKESVISSDANTNEAYHGNYFGIYNIVNFLGALTSDVDFGDQGTSSDESSDVGTGAVRTSDNTETGTYGADYDGQTFYGWKRNHKNERIRNNGNSYNKVALASGVYLELTTEESTGKELYEKVWGPITGVIELDLINVQTGIGGGFIYAKNVHGKRRRTGHVNTTLTALNTGAVTRFDFEYSTTEDNTHQTEWQSSGNFVHSTQTIIDDCYNVSGKYMGTDKVPAHYWYIKGQVYVYDQYISAYTGTSNAYSETVDIPLTITAASHGTMKLLNIKPNKYAYLNTNGEKLGADQKLIINDVTYYLNTPISYWDWYKLTKSEQALFKDNTYVVSDDCWIGNTEYKAGYVMLDTEYNTLRDSNPSVYQKVEKEDGTIGNVSVAFDDMFHSSNNLSHDTGYILTYKVTNPTEWDTWYTLFNSSDQTKNQIGGEGYNNGPTYRLISNTGALLGQRRYEEGGLISKEVYEIYQDVVADHSEAIPHPDPENEDYEDLKQATFEKAWIVTKQTTVKEGGQERHLYPKYVVSNSYKNTYSLGSSVTEAYICTKSIQLSATEFIYINDKMTLAEKNAYINRVAGEIATLEAKVEKTEMEKKTLATLKLSKADIESCVVPAYYCTSPGLYGGNYYESGKNYRGLEAWSSMTADDRAKFTFNYDALDLLIDPSFDRAEGVKYQYDGYGFTTKEQAKTNRAGYSIEQPVDYTATYNGTETAEYNGVTLENGKEYKRSDYEKLPNEQRHYAAITVTDENVEDGSYNVYVVHRQGLVIGNTPYAIGATISFETYQSMTDKSDITVLTFTEAGTYYYCRESYKVNENGNGVAVTNTNGTAGFDNDGQSVSIKSTAYGQDDTVPIGVVITSTNYGSLPNKQLNFTIHGKAPTETSMFYVSRFSDIKDLSKEKIITVVYQYDYEESDVSGTHVTPISERHVVNIHLQFKSGIPTVEDIKAPQIVIPGNLVGLSEPRVIPGATEIMGGGWELYASKEDAESRSNAIPFSPLYDPLYWYQHGYFVRYYCLTNIGGKSYSNYVNVSVANYHDLKAVMDDKLHHYYVDIPDLVRLKRVPKIYINDYSASSQNGLDLLKNLFDLSLLNSESTGVTDGVVTAEGNLNGHALLNEQVKECDNLEFFLRSNLNYSGAEWTPIANTYEDHNEGCFTGTLHGDGHYVSGLTNSLFGHLCGDVYNLGVKGSFTGAGIAETGSGYVENCWISTNSKSEKTNKPVFGEPSSSTERPYRIVNCYYEEEDGATNPYTNHSDTNHSGGYGIPMRKSKQAFYNGEVAYDLNGFYLYKRYNDHITHSGTPTPFSYFVDDIDTDGDPILTLKNNGKYDNDAKLCSSGYNGWKYVEDRFADGDFIYAEGEIPENNDLRLYTDPTTKETSYYPIWPDDYIFFGQMLNYDYGERTHQDYPSSLNRSDDRIQTSIEGNRVYRAPAYFRSSEMGVAHFNPYAVFAQTKNGDATKIAHKNMTAIDFTGHNDPAYAKGVNGKYFYPPLLDDDGLSDFQNIDLTQNLLVYTSASGGTGTDESPTAAQQTANVVSSYLPDEAYAETKDTYHTVDYRDPTHIHGHWVQKVGDGYVASLDHLLVDRNDFNAPIAYAFASGKRMWYQRKPDNYVGKKKDDGTYIDNHSGWEGVSLPFKADIVTTNQKGEITHFYSGSEESKNGTGTKIGHEYWLREFQEGGTPSGDIYTAKFNYPDAKSADGDKEYTNTFLWDYYYSKNNRDDLNKDDYQTYYKADENDIVKTFEDYPRLAAATPYIIGFPGERYYEFDLSGKFEAKTTDTPNPTQLGQQTITFASKPGETSIGVSDAAIGVTADGYTFMPTYLNMELEAGTKSYVLALDGGSYNIVPAEGESVKVAAFRPYFVYDSGDHAKKRVAEHIIFDMSDDTSFAFEDNDPKQEEIGGELRFYAKKRLIGVESSLSKETDVLIVNTSGLTIANFTIQPGETIETPVPMAGVYIIRAAGGKYIKKVVVK